MPGAERNLLDGVAVLEGVAGELVAAVVGMQVFDAAGRDAERGAWHVGGRRTAHGGLGECRGRV